MHAFDELDARPRVVAQQEVPVEVDVVAQARDLRPGSDREARLVHAAEHDSEPQSTGDVGDADLHGPAATGVSRRAILDGALDAGRRVDAPTLEQEAP